MAEQIVLASFASRAEAEFARAALEAHGIRAVLSADDGGGWFPHLLAGVGGAKLLVLEQDLEQARLILDSTDDET